MKVVVVGATGNIGTAVVERLASDPEVDEVVGVARRLPETPEARAPGGRSVRWRALDVRLARPQDVVGDADAVVDLAWMFHPTRRPDITWSTNVIGLVRLLEALPSTSVSQLVVASSIAAYSPAGSDAPVAEDWPTHGASSAAYAREKAYVERLLDLAERPGLVVSRLRPAFVFQWRASSEQRRIFAGPLVPGRLMRPELAPRLPIPAGLRLQVVHARDVADAVARILARRAPGPFNLCADQVLTESDVAEAVGSRAWVVPPRVARAALGAAWRTRAAPVPPELFDALMRVPVLSHARARSELDWAPTRTATEALQELLGGMQAGAGHGTPPLHPDR
ncbi:NAD-dependent epimerase [Nocardioides gansuensis]|uniref:NAD-dependent epimerase n=1 Tax=Nocardioides gansuensis TaxID=2138300 RepID=A0A2T8FCR5_9ACTN|nr:NAD-dependent epimerase [Nocardioides gansuensis]